MRYTRPIAVAWALLLGAGLCGPSALAQTVSAERGKAVAGQWCTDCHSTGATAEAGDVGPTFDEIIAGRSPDYIRGFLSNPHVRGSMPPFDLARQHIEDIIAYMQSLR